MPKFVGIDISGYRISQYVDIADPSNLPFGTLACDGSAISRTLYAKLFAKIGTTYGAGDGSTTFNIPDRRGRALVGAGTGPSLSARAVGDVLGEETHTLSLGEMPSHNHGGGNHGHSIQLTRSRWFWENHNGTLWADEPLGVDTRYTDNSGTIIGSNGSDGAHNNMQPSLVAQQAIAYI